MGALRNIALVILTFSGLLFVALFGRLPFFRKTPIGFFHRVIWIHIPSVISYLDSRLLNGRLLHCLGRSGTYLLHENHPLVLIFFSSLLVIGQCLFIPSAWSRVSMTHRLFIPIVIALPYVLLYTSVVTKSFITTENNTQELKRYPYDNVIFHPGHRCRTCNLLKPARSIMLTYGACLGYSLLSGTLDRLIPRSSNLRTRRQTWTMFFNIMAVVISSDIRVGAVTLLMFMTAPLAFAFLVYHAYLIWAGMTTNESAKWSDWKEDVADGIVYKLNNSINKGNTLLGESRQRHSHWPMSSDQILVLTDGDPPREGHQICAGSNEILQPSNLDAPIDRRWVRVKSMGEVDNIYDLGFWGNVRHVFGYSIRRKPQHI